MVRVMVASPMLCAATGPLCSNNMLYPVEDKINRKLKYQCKRCNHEEDADDPCIYQRQVIHRVDEYVLHPVFFCMSRVAG